MQDLSNYSLAQLRKLEVQVVEELKGRHFLSVSQAREQILHIAQSAGLSVKELLASKPSKTAAPSQQLRANAKYQRPDDPSQQWSGRGRKPNWVKAWISAGKSLDDIKI